ncbi:MAG: hypothetical protein IPG45_35415 [Deltaproteobacteria bacterium]|nr:hypothetical protein [Deltaproteobacteria bacterium]
MKLRVWLWVGCILGAATPSKAADVGEIAVIEDVGNTIGAVVFTPNFYLERAACAFYQTHADQYDVLFVFTSAQLNALTRVQQGWATKRAAMGIGRDNALDTQARFCSTRLAHAIKGGDIDSYANDPDARYTGILLFPLTGVQLLAHELGHQWLSSVRFDRGDGVPHCFLRGFEPLSAEPQPGNCDGHEPGDYNQHWSYYLNGGSLMYANEAQDLGGGQFLLSNPSPKFSALDQYLMGLRDPAEVPPMFLIDVGDVQGSGSAALPLPANGTAMVSGTRFDFTIDDVIRFEGPRVPAREACHKKAAFILLHPEGQPPTAAQIAKVDAHRVRFESFYDSATDQRGSFDTTLAGSGLGTIGCPGVASPPLDGGVSVDAGPTDSGAPDVGHPDLGGNDLGFGDLGSVDLGAPDRGVDDLGANDVGPEDGGAPPQDAGFAGDTGVPNEEPKTLSSDDCSCRTSTNSGTGAAVVILLSGMCWARRRR